MEILSFNMPMNWNLFLFGDDHIGATLRYKRGWQQLVDMMHSKYDGLPENCNYGVHHGDIVEAILIDDKRYSEAETEEKTAFAQSKASIQALGMIKSKLLCVLDGNHPNRLLEKHGDITKHVCEEIDVAYGTYTARTTYNDKKGKCQFKHFATHGNGSITSQADDPERRRMGMKLALKKKLKMKSGDTLLNSMGHTHKLIRLEPSNELYLADDGGEIKQHYTGAPNGASGYIHPDYKFYCNTGSFLKLYGEGFSGYAERAGYDPLELGFIVCRVRDGQPVKLDKVVLD